MFIVLKWTFLNYMKNSTSNCSYACHMWSRDARGRSFTFHTILSVTMILQDFYSNYKAFTSEWLWNLGELFFLYCIYSVIYLACSLFSDTLRVKRLPFHVCTGGCTSTLECFLCYWEKLVSRPSTYEIWPAIDKFLFALWKDAYIKCKVV